MATPVVELFKFNESRHSMKVVILCGGLGTRLREETEYRPKPMVPIGDRPILWHIMKYYAHFGHREFILCLGYKGSVIKDFFRNYHWNTSSVTLQLGSPSDVRFHHSHPENDWTVTLLETGRDTQTGGRIKRAIDHVTDDTFLMTYGDGLTDVDINSTIELHKSAGGTATLTAVQPTARFGELLIQDGRVSRFHEKPTNGGFINGGYFVLNRRVADYLTGDACVFEREPLEALAREQQLNAYSHIGYWQCMDTYREYVELNGLWDEGNPPWKKWNDCDYGH